MQENENKQVEAYLTDGALSRHGASVEGQSRRAAQSRRVGENRRTA